MLPHAARDPAGFRRVAAKKRASVCGCEDAARYSTQNSRPASRIAWIMACYQDSFSIAIHQNAQTEPPNTHSRIIWQQSELTPLRCTFARLFACRRARQSCLLSQAPRANTPLFPLQGAKRSRTPRPLSTLRVRSCGSSFQTTAFERPLAAQMSFAATRKPSACPSPCVSAPRPLFTCQRITVCAHSTSGSKSNELSAVPSMALRSSAWDGLNSHPDNLRYVPIRAVAVRLLPSANG